MKSKENIILVVKEVEHNADDVVSTYYKSHEEYKEFTKDDKIIKEWVIKKPNSETMKQLENGEIDIESWIDNIQKNKMNISDDELIFQVTKEQLAKGYGIDDFELHLEEFEGIRYLVAFGNSEPGEDDFGLGDTEKYKESAKGVIEEYDRDGCDIDENGVFVNHKEIYKIHLQEEISNKKQNLKNLLDENTRNIEKGKVVNLSEMIGKAENIQFKKDKLKQLRTQAKGNKKSVTSSTALKL